jgi:hypothetical protein
MSIRQDVAYALRTLRQAPGFAVAAILSLRPKRSAERRTAL